MLQNRQIIGTHTLKIRCVCTDENATCKAHKLLKTLDTGGFTYDCVISTTTFNSVSSRTDTLGDGGDGQKNCRC